MLFMEICESNLQSHLFSYLSSSGFLPPPISCSWTVVKVAAVTAVMLIISFWKIRPIKVLSHPGEKSVLESLLSDQKTQEEVINEEAAAVEGVTTPERWQKEQLAYSPSVCVIRDNVWAKGKFTVYFEDDDVGDTQVDAGINFSGSYCSGRQQLSDWKCYEGMTWRRRMEDLGWYRYLDLTVLNGSVVKLWEGQKLGETDYIGAVTFQNRDTCEQR